MPHYSYSQQNFDGFVNPAQLYPTLPVVYDQDVSYGAQDMSDNLLLRPAFNENIFDPKMQASTWRETSADYSATTSARTSPRIPNTRTIRDDCSASSTSASTPPSPSNPPIHQTSNNKRRAQNRAAQRAYRDRKTRYQLDLQSGIKDIEEKIRLLQNENTDLIRQLCEMRAANNDLRDTTQNGNVESLPQALHFRRAEEAWSSTSFTTPSAGELEGLYEPFAAMWNLIQLDPSVVQGTVSAQTILERLRGMAQVPQGSLGLNTSYPIPVPGRSSWTSSPGRTF